MQLIEKKIKIRILQAQYSYTVVETLMAHLDENAKSSPTIRTSIAEVLSKIIAIAAGESVGMCFCDLLLGYVIIMLLYRSVCFGDN